MKIVIATNNDDWEGLYINDYLVTQGHEVTVDEVARAIAERLVRLDIQYERKDVDPRWLYERSDFPETLEEVIFLND
jgi:hypothetical protein